MGHSTATVYLEVTEVNSKLPTDILTEGIHRWHIDEASRYDSARGGYPEMKPVSSRAASGSAIREGDVHSEHSVIVPVTDEFSEKTKNVRVEVTASELAQLRKGYTWELREEGRFGPHVTNVEIVALPKPRAPKAEATEGKAVTKYVVNGASRLPEYDSQAEARAAAVEFMKAHPECSELSVSAIIRRDTGKTALVRITRPEPELSTVTFAVTTQTPKPGARVVGYLIAFDYHH